ncbi:hypothetical protein TNCV_2675001 [Trichonephila clavipes]|nr:hypothetical protein TNCV_2675001 [Trichonephila clavipes]
MLRWPSPFGPLSPFSAFEDNSPLCMSGDSQLPRKRSRPQCKLDQRLKNNLSLANGSAPGAMIKAVPVYPLGAWGGLPGAQGSDDTAILSRHRNLDTLVENINEHLAHLETWFSVWKIALNSSKTEAVFFSKRKPPLKLLYKIKEYPGLNTPSILV